MYLADPRSGRWRRAHAQEKVVHAVHETGEAVDVVARDLAHRTRGLWFKTWGRLRHEEVDDTTLEARVRSALGWVCSHPGAIQVSARAGSVELKGAILKSEHKKVLSRVRRVRGVRDLDDDLDVYKRAEGHPELQGGKGQRGAVPGPFQLHWSPTMRLFASVGGLGLAAWGLSRRGAAGMATGFVGLTLGLRGLTNLPLRRLVGVGAGRLAISFHKDITVMAPVDEVFAFWSAMENFPRFMSHVEEVRKLSEDRFHWKIQGPAGTSFAWDAVVTQRIPNELLAWKSEEGAMVENAGIIRFEAVPTGTRLDIRLSYNPPAGAIGHAFAKLLGADPKKQMDDDLLRFKSLLERGKATGHETVTRQDVAPTPEPGQRMH
jgi:uncharacterized membrane protein